MPHFNEPVVATSNLPTVGAVQGECTNHTPQAGPGVYGHSDGTGVWGKSETWMGVYGETTSTKDGACGVFGKNLHGAGVRGVSSGAGEKGVGVVGINAAAPSEFQDPGAPFAGGGPGVWGQSEYREGMHGVSKHGTGEMGAGIVGINESTSGAAGPGVFGTSAGPGVWGHSTTWHGVAGMSDSTTGGAGIYGKGATLAALFEGDVKVTGDIRLANADLAEEFEVAADEAEPGTVMALACDGTLVPSAEAYSKKVMGVVSGAGGYKPAIILDRRGATLGRAPIALVGKVCVKVDAQYGPVEPGDLLTSSPTPGHAMKATDPLRAFGSVIGKALEGVASGRGMVVALVVRH